MSSWGRAWGNAWGNAWGAVAGYIYPEDAARSAAAEACVTFNTILHRSVCMGHAIESDVRLGEIGCTSVTMGNELNRCAALGKTIERSTCFDAVNEAEAVIVGPIYNWVDMDD